MKDYFSKQSAAYAIYRPRYPQILYEFIMGFIHSRKIAWDAGTGNGQTATVLAGSFEKVYATDISPQQLAHAPLAPNITYLQEPAEHTSITSSSVNLVTVSQALHWFSFEDFYREVRRVAAPGAVFAAWGYSLMSISGEIDHLVRAFHFETLKGFWDPARSYVDNGYNDIPFPFLKIVTPEFFIRTTWTLQELEGYLNTWSAVQQFISSEGKNPVTELINKIAPYWGTGKTREVVFPVHLKMGYIQ